MTLLTIVELTPWFLPPVNPARAGMYIVDFPEYVKCKDAGIYYAHFNGIDWGYMYSSFSTAVDAGKSKTDRHTQLAWRGLANDPNESTQMNPKTDDKPLHGDAYRLCTVGLLAVANIVIWGHIAIKIIFQ